MPSFDHNGLRTHFEFLPHPDRPVLALSHSLGATLAMWDAQVAELAAHFSLLRYDTRGHGDSSVPRGPYRVEELGQDLVALLDHLKLERVHLCGLSMGGVIAQWMGAHAAERVDRLVLVSTAAKIGTESGWNERIAMVRERGLASIAGSTMERWFTESFRWKDPDAIGAVRAAFERSDPEGYTACCAAIRDADARGTLESIAARTLIVFGTQDPVTTGMDAGFLAAHIPNSQVGEVNGAHLLNVEQPEAFNRLVREFLLAEDSME